MVRIKYLQRYLQRFGAM